MDWRRSVAKSVPVARCNEVLRAEFSTGDEMDATSAYIPKPVPEVAKNGLKIASCVISTSQLGSVSGMVGNKLCPVRWTRLEETESSVNPIRGWNTSR